VLALGEDPPPSVDKLAQQLTGAAEAADRREAGYQLGKLGAAAVPALPALIKALGDRDKQVWSYAVATIAGLGPTAKDAVPALIDDLGSGERGGRERERRQKQMRTAFALSRIGAAAIPPLLESLASDDAWRRTGAVIALGGMQGAAREAVPALIKSLADGDETARNAAVEALSQIGLEAKLALLAALADGDAKRRAGAALALGPLGDVVAPLAQSLGKETDVAVRAALLTALGKSGGEPAQVVPLLAASVKDDNEAVSRAAINALAGSRAFRRPAVAPLGALLKDANVLVRERAARALGRLGPDAAEALPALLEAARANGGAPVFADALAQVGPAALPALLAELKKSDTAGSEWILQTLRGFGAPALPVLSETLQASSPALRIAAARTLAEMGPEAALAEKPLLTAAGDSDPAVQAAALRALVASRSESPRLRPLLEAALKSSSPELRKAGTAGLASVGGATTLGADGLIVLLADEDAATRLLAVQSLGQLGAKAAPAVPALIERMNDPALQLPIVDTLGKIGSAAAAAVPRLTELATTGGAEWRVAAIVALGGIGREAASALPVIYDGARDPSFDVRAAAVPALVKVESDEAKLLEVLVKAVSDETGRVRRPAAQAIGTFGDRARAAVPGLVAMLERDNDRGPAFEALKAIGVVTVPDLQKMLGAKDAKVRVFACESLGKLGSQATDAVAALEPLAKAGEGDAVGRAAREALKRINPPPPAP
jgi:HEAT repeat protein